MGPNASWRASGMIVLILLVAVLGAWVNVAVAEPATPGSDIERQARLMQRAGDAVVGVQALALEGARSAATLGHARSGSGVVIGPEGLVLTIGYLILEAEQVQVMLDDERTVPARVVAYDVATGFGLLQPLAPLRIEPVPLGNSAGIADQEPLMVASGGGGGGVGVARLVSRRPFAGYWEYHIEGALFTTPPRSDHSGAGLFNARGELVGIGSLIVADARGPNADYTPGNMFVPIDLLPPIFAELRTQGRSTASRRAWLGVNCVEQEGEVRVLQVSSDSPADAAGVQPGDRILRIDGAEVAGLAMLWQSLWRGGQPEREITLEIERNDRPQLLRLHSVDRMQVLKRASGI
jgi:serine protease Do